MNLYAKHSNDRVDDKNVYTYITAMNSYFWNTLSYKSDGVFKQIEWHARIYIMKIILLEIFFKLMFYHNFRPNPLGEQLF
jgi:hypothetical protein